MDLKSSVVDLKSFFSDEKNWSKFPSGLESKLKTYLDSNNTDLDDDIINYIKHADIVNV